MRPLADGRTVDWSPFTLDRVHVESTSADHALLVERVWQRNWSRCAIARSGAGELYFLKQFVSRASTWHPEQLAAERTTAERVRKVVQSCRVSMPVGCMESAVTLVYPWEEVRSVDEVLRENPGQVREFWPSVVERLAAVVQELADSRCGEDSSLRRKRSPNASGAEALLFKGFEVRNVGWPTSSESLRDLLIFDYGPSYLSTTDEAAAKLLVSTAMLNWGHPATRHVRGVPKEMTSAMREALGPHLTRSAVEAEIESVKRSRVSAPMAKRSSVRRIKAPVIDMAMRIYLRSAQDYLSEGVM